MIAYKFLTTGAVGRFSEFAWPDPPAWVEIEGRLEECVRGIHACSRDDLPAWIDDELWVVELDGEIRESESVLVAERGRLVRRVAAWSDETALAFVEACVLRAREQAFRALRRNGLTPAAHEVLASVEQKSVAVEIEAAALAADAAALARGRRPDAWETHPGAATVDQPPSATAANLGFVVAHAAGREAVVTGGDADYATGFAAERAWQVEWLSDRLGLDAE